jgi:hypothetical protein
MRTDPHPADVGLERAIAAWLEAFGRAPSVIGIRSIDIETRKQTAYLTPLWDPEEDLEIEVRIVCSVQNRPREAPGPMPKQKQGT